MQTEELSVEQTDSRVVIFAGGRVIADSIKASVVRVQGEEAVWLIPKIDVNGQWLRPSMRPSEDGSNRQYFDVLVNGTRVQQVAWTCNGDNVSPSLASHVAFSDGTVDRVAVLPKVGRSEPHFLPFEKFS